MFLSRVSPEFRVEVWRLQRQLHGNWNRAKTRSWLRARLEVGFAFFVYSGLRDVFQGRVSIPFDLQETLIKGAQSSWLKEQMVRHSGGSQCEVWKRTEKP